MINFINLTPHNITVIQGEEKRTIEASGDIARISVETKIVGELDGIPVSTQSYGEIEGLPAPQADTIYIVSGLVRSAVKGRPDVVAPNTGAAIRNEKGHIIGVPGFVR